jgi:hypothetical protein
MAYWRKVFARAWADTKQSFGWNQKTAATVVVAAVGLVITFFQLGFAATVASAIGSLSAGAALSSLVAGAVLFVWNFFSPQANLYLELSKTSSEKITALESALADLKEPPGLEKKQFTRVVPSGTNQRISFYTSLNPDCTASGNVNVRVTKQPEHGTVEIVATTNFPTYPKEHIRSKCNDHKVRGMQVNYKSAEKYVGSDELDLLILFPTGFAWEVHYDISVR